MSTSNDNFKFNVNDNIIYIDPQTSSPIIGKIAIRAIFDGEPYYMIKVFDEQHGLIARVEWIEEPNLKARNRITAKPTLMNELPNQADISFLFPSYSDSEKKWRRTSIASGLFADIRRSVTSVVDKPIISTVGNTLELHPVMQKQNIRTLNDEEYEILFNCATEVTKILAKYKESYLKYLVKKSNDKLAKEILSDYNRLED